VKSTSSLALAAHRYAANTLRPLIAGLSQIGLIVSTNFQGSSEELIHGEIQVILDKLYKPSSSALYFPFSIYL
jgi:hypothetical protein